MRILILNWRCPSHPKAGGAEVLTFEIAKGLVAAGHSVEWFAGSFPGAVRVENLQGVRLVRRGLQWTVHLSAFIRYYRKLRSRYDLVIDEVNTMPFFTPLWAKIPVVMLIYQLAREVWWYESPFPISLIGFTLEPFYLRFYRRVPVVTESASTLADLRQLGFTGKISVIPIGVGVRRELSPKGSEFPYFIYVGRLTPSKRVADIIRAFGVFRQVHRDARLDLVGDGPAKYVTDLHRLVQLLHLENSVAFCGRVSEKEKQRLMGTAFALLMASVREGWGLVVSEANARGTPAIVYDVAGLRDSVRHEETGLVVAPTPAAMADGMLRMWREKSLYEDLRKRAYDWSKTLSFEEAAKAVRAVVADNVTPPEAEPAAANVLGDRNSESPIT